MPSQFSHEILNANPYAYLDDAPLEERRARAVEMRRILPESVLEEVGKLDPAAIAKCGKRPGPMFAMPTNCMMCCIRWLRCRRCPVLRQSWSRAALAAVSVNSTIRGGVLRATGPAGARGGGYRSQRPRHLRQHHGAYWVAAERAKCFSAALSGRPVSNSRWQTDLWCAIRSRRRFARSGDRLDGAPRAHHALRNEQHCWACRRARSIRPCLRMEARRSRLLTARQVHASRPDGAARQIEWCDRRLLARIHRLTVATLRKQIEPVTAAQFMRWLLRWQHVAPGTQVSGERGTLEVLRQLQGFEIPANAWERQVLARRIADYDPEWLDQLCLTGAVGWGRLSPHPATLEDSAEGKRRVIPTSVAPITFFVREEADWMTPHHPRRDQPEARGAEPGCAAGLGLPAAARRIVFCRHRARHRQAESGDGNRAVGTGGGGTGHRRRFR